MIDYLGVEGVEDLLAVIPDHLRSKTLDLPDPILGGHELRTHVTSLLDHNKSAADLVSFLGSDCYRHYVPAVCDEINGRSEFLTAYSGRAYEDHGRYQALWENTSMMGELLEMDVVSLPTCDGYQAAATSLRMASRLTGRGRALIAGSTSTAKQSKLSDYCRPALHLSTIDWAPSGELDMNHLVRELVMPGSDHVA